MDCGPPGSSVHGIFQARVLEWGAIVFSEMTFTIFFLILWQAMSQWWCDHYLEPDILECEVKWALGSITRNKASGGDGIPVELFQILKKWCCESAALNMLANLENSAVATGLEMESADGDCSHEIKRHLQKRTRWHRSRWMWITSPSMDTLGIHLHSQKCLQNTS